MLHTCPMITTPNWQWPGLIQAPGSWLLLVALLVVVVALAPRVMAPRRLLARAHPGHADLRAGGHPAVDGGGGAGAHPASVSGRHLGRIPGVPAGRLVGVN